MEDEAKHKEKLKYLNKKYSQFAQPKKGLLVALEISLGNVTEAAKKANISRRSFYNYVDNDEDFKEAVEDINEQSLDFAESLLKRNMQNGSDTAIIFYLKTKGKKRGYVERNEVTGKDGGPIQTQEIIIEL